MTNFRIGFYLHTQTHKVTIAAVSHQILTGEEKIVLASIVLEFVAETI